MTTTRSSSYVDSVHRSAAASVPRRAVAGRNLGRGLKRNCVKDPQLRDRLVALVGMREAGVHGLGEIWAGAID